MPAPRLRRRWPMLFLAIAAAGTLVTFGVVDDEGGCGGGMVAPGETPSAQTSNLNCAVNNDCFVEIVVAAPRLPALSRDPALTPSYGTVGERFLVAFVLEAAITQDPIVTVELPQPRALRQVRAAGTEYTYEYRADGTEPAGTWPVLIRYGEAAAAQSLTLTPGITLDFTAPALSALTFAPGSEGAPMRLRFTASEDLRQDPEVALQTYPPRFFRVNETTTRRDEGTYELLYQPRGDEPRGSWAVTVQVADRAGNSGHQKLPDPVVFADTRPVDATLSWDGPGTDVGVRSFRALVSRPVRLVSATLENERAEPIADVSDDVVVGDGGAERTLLHGTIALSQLPVADLTQANVTLVVATVGDGREVTLRTPSLAADTRAPRGPKARILGPKNIDTDTVTLELSAEGAIEMEILGEVFLPRSDRRWLPYAPTLELRLFPGEGLKTVRVRFRDAAGNATAVVRDWVYVGGTIIRGEPLLLLPDGQESLRNNQSVRIGGEVEPGSELVRAYLEDVRDGEVLQALESLKLSVDGKLSGEFVARVSSGATVSLVVIVRAHGTVSDASVTRSASYRVE